MLTSRQFFEQILLWKKNGQTDLIRQASKERSQALRAERMGRLFVYDAIEKLEGKRGG